MRHRLYSVKQAFRAHLPPCPAQFAIPRPQLVIPAQAGILKRPPTFETK